MRSTTIALFWVLSSSLVALTGCSTPAPVKRSESPAQLFASACQIGRANNSVQGHLWLKATSKEFSGQFPADVNVKAPDQLKLEISNVLGGTEAVIRVDGESYEVFSGNVNPQKKMQGYGSWGGIPLRWATDLFLGKIPCPETQQGWKLSLDQDEQLVVAKVEKGVFGKERFTYRFRDIKGKPWPEFLLWERAGDKVEFKFDDPESEGFSPKKWEAKSMLGHVKVRWGKRESSSAH